MNRSKRRHAVGTGRWRVRWAGCRLLCGLLDLCRGTNGERQRTAHGEYEAWSWYPYMAETRDGDTPAVPLPPPGCSLCGDG